ncbi:competence/damage-inducible protein A [Candidatus Omnitrophota bacterium]
MEISASVICIGNEILLGHITNTNAEYISRNLSSAGIRTTRHISIPDEPEIIISSIRAALNNSSIVILTGGLGPTVDDLTLECIARALDKKLIFQDKVAKHIKAHFKKRKLKMPKNNLRQALVPEGAKPILNNIGTAPGLLIPLYKKALIAVPGVPFEIYPMLKRTIIPFLKKNFQTGKIVKSRLIRITGLPESSVNEKIKDILKIKGNVQMGIYPHPGEINVKITLTEQNRHKINSTIDNIEKRIRSRLKNYIFGYDDENLEQAAGKCLLNAKKTLSIAESCTGGLLGDRITSVPGSSRYFRTGIVVYSNESKNKILNIPLKTIKRYGAVSKKVAGLMAKNVRVLAETDIGIGISGIAGPGGGAKKKPVGLVYVALSTNKKTISKEFHFLGQRKIVKYKAAQAALDMLRLELLKRYR